MIPPPPEQAASILISSSSGIGSCFTSWTMLSKGLFRGLSSRTSFALLARVDVKRRSFASLSSKTYRSSLAGNAGERGSAMASCARIARKVTSTRLEWHAKYQIQATYQHSCSHFLQEMLLSPHTRVNLTQTAKGGALQRQRPVTRSCMYMPC
jgi:hypothetical protein